MYFDSHVHTEFSADSEMKAVDALREAAKQGFGLVFTEHLDYDFPSAGTEEFIFDPEAYWAKYEPLRAEGKLLLGVEMGMMASAREKNAAFVRRVPFDFVLASIHFLDVKDLYYPETFEGREKGEMYHEYFTVMRDEIYAHPFINALAHIDYIARNAPFDNPEISYGDFSFCAPLSRRTPPSRSIRAASLRRAASKNSRLSADAIVSSAGVTSQSAPTHTSHRASVAAMTVPANSQRPSISRSSHFVSRK